MVDSTTTTPATKLTSTCHCKAVRITFPRPVKALNECLCSICRRYGALWAYYKPAEVQVEGEANTESYIWNDRVVEFRRCRDCGCVTHWTAVDKTQLEVGINCRMLEREDMVGLKIEQEDGPE